VTPEGEVRAEAAHQSPDWVRTPERSNALALRVMSWIALRCGRTASRAVLRLAILYFLVFASGPRRHSRRFLARALGRRASVADLHRHLFSFAAVTLDRVYLLRERLDLFRIGVQGGELIESLLAQGQGAFLVGAHMGSFEVMRSASGAHAQRIAMLMYPDNARKIAAAFEAIAPGAQARVIPLGRMDAMLALRDWLDAGGLAGMLADRSIPGESMRAGMVTVPFLGREAQFSDGPFRLAALLRRPVVFMAGLYAGDNQYDVRFEPLADFRERASDVKAREERIHEAVRAYAARLEALCRSHPYNWFNFHDFWHEDD